MTIKSIRLELARAKDHPNGDSHHAFVLRAPLDANGFLDKEVYMKNRDLCSATKISPDTGDETGRLIHTRSGWAISYAAGEDDDEGIFNLGRHPLRVGEYITITEHDGEERTFRVASVENTRIRA
jgi:hypothetical protein